ncbi:MAG: DUF2254 domain-containing protein [Deltaproteobacteria bacterium]|nr:DUF2254 domain-containing protein [Deltaproteobacteria bacterium]
MTSSSKKKKTVKAEEQYTVLSTAQSEVSADRKKSASQATDSYGSFVSTWLKPISFVAGLAVSSYLLLRILDYYISDGTHSYVDVLFLDRAEDVGDAIGGVSEVLIAILGLVVTVVAIVVQLAAQRYTPKLVDLFVEDTVNISFFVLMVVASMYSMLLIYSTTTGFIPFWGAFFLLVMTTVILSLLIPYFSYVFRFLTPGNIIRIIRQNAKGAMGRVLNPKIRKEEIRRHQQNVAMAMEQISDISLSAVSQMDRNVALLSIRSLKDVMVDHLLIKRKMPTGWFVPIKEHFPAISTDFFQELYSGRNWVEMKGFLDMDLIFKNAVTAMPDAVSAIANSTKIIGLYAIKLKDNQVLSDVIQFFNTFLRHAINARNPKAIYNLFYQYRLLAEEVLIVNPQQTERIAFYFKYYGQIAQTYNIPLILITACFDLAHLLRRAYMMKVPNLEALVDTFLEIDDNPATQANEFELRSVRKAQLMFASFMVSQGEVKLVEKIVNDIKVEPKDRMVAIHKEMMAVKDRKFWEVTDRGVDFFYLDDDQKKWLNELFTTYIDPYYEKKNGKGKNGKGKNGK